MNIKNMIASALVSLTALGGTIGAASIMPAAHAGPSAPYISATVTSGGLVLHVSGSGFGSGDHVQVFGFKNGDLSNPQNLVLYAFTTATQSGWRLVKGQWVYVRGGQITTDITDLSARCHPQYLTVQAEDDETGAMSNQVPVTMGYLC
jgi:hypothetical protein